MQQRRAIDEPGKGRGAIVLYNPHGDDFLSAPLHFFITRRRPLRKYGGLIGLLQARGKLQVLVDGTISTLLPGPVLALFPDAMRRRFTLWEASIWARLNKLECEFLTVPPPNASEQTLLMFTYRGARGTGNLVRARQENVGRFGRVVAHLSHFHLRSMEKGRNLRPLADILDLAADADVGNSDYFKRSFPWYRRKVLVLPFFVRDEFFGNAEFSSRIDKIIATGTFHHLTYVGRDVELVDYRSFFGISPLHFVRSTLFEKARDHVQDVEVLCSPIGGRTKVDLGALNRQSGYFAIPMSQRYRQYKFAVCGDERIGVPSIGSLEAMAAGCCTFAVEGCLHGLGLVAMKHYVPYDGSLEDLVTKLRDMRHAPVLAEAIAKAAAAHVRRCFRVDPGNPFWNTFIERTVPNRT